MPEADVDHIYNYPTGYIEDILKSVKTIAMVGASAVSYTHLTLPTTVDV